MNYIKVKRGDYIAIQPDEPHFYVQGNIIECMANSDNVVRGGLTPKLKDEETLLKILNFEMKNERPLSPKVEEVGEGLVKKYFTSGFEEFNVLKIEQTSGSAVHKFPTL